MTKPVYEYKIYNPGEAPPTLMIVDRFDEADPTMTVTNGMEFVLKEIEAELPGNLDDYRIIYRDTEGSWDAAVYSEGTAYFGPGHLDDEEADELWETLL